MIDRRTTMVAGAGLLAIPGLVSGQVSSTGLFCSSLEEKLTCWKPDLATGSLTKLSEISMPGQIQFGWRHPKAQVVYLGLAETKTGGKNLLATVAFDKDGKLSLLGTPIPIERPIHLTVDQTGTYVMLTINTPAHIAVYPIQADHTVGPMIEQSGKPPFGIFGHQVRVLPSGKTAMLVTRGVRSTKYENKDPGGLRFFSFGPGGKLTYRESVAPNGGFSFGPRDCDFSKDGRFAYQTLELQNKLLTFGIHNDRFTDEPIFTASSTPDLTKPYEEAGIVLGDIHLHPGGHSVYAANRSSLFTKPEEAIDTICHFKLNPKTGEPTLAGQYNTEGQHPRTFFINGSGKMLVAANVRVGPALVDGKPVAKAPVCLTTFLVAPDGALKLANRYEIATPNGENQYWCAFV